jgi:hypothetical protein
MCEECCFAVRLAQGSRLGKMVKRGGADFNVDTFYAIGSRIRLKNARCGWMKIWWLP